MKRDNQDHIVTAIGVCAFIAAYFFIPARFFLAFNDLPNQYFYYAFQKKKVPPVKIVAVAIDDYSLNKMAAQWPWKRSVYAQAIRALDGQGVKTIGFDRVLKGASQDRQDEEVFVDALKKAGCAVVLGYDFDFKGLSPGFPAPAIMAVDPSVGMLNTLLDDDKVIRKMRVQYNVRGREYYSFSAVMAGSVRGEKPGRVISMLPAVKDSRFRAYHNIEDYYFYINYTVKQSEKSSPVAFISFYDVLNNMDDLKKEWGRYFLRDSMVLVYPAAEVTHDVHLTPLGRMPGGLTHLNAIINILSHSGLKSPGYLPVLFVLVSAVVLWFALRPNDSRIALLAFMAVLVFNVLGAIVLWYFNIKVDFARSVIFSGIFFIFSGVYKSAVFLARLAAIRERATHDPLRGLYTLRYFSYRLELEARRHTVYVVMAHLVHFKGNTDDIPIDRLKEIWAGIHAALSKVQHCWASYSLDEVVGFSLQGRERLEGTLLALRDSLNEVFKNLELVVEVKICAAEFTKEWAGSDLFFALANQVRSLKANVLVMPAIQPSMPGRVLGQAPGVQPQLLDNLAEDIEEKNRQLLNLYEKLKVEHDKTKEAFYQIITSLVNALEARDPYTQGHSQRVAEYALRMADRLGWPQDQKERLRKASLLHDLGKIGIPDAILHKKGQLNEEEFNFIKQHEIFAVNILKPLKEIEDILPWILYHHEKWDGTGYPHGLGGDAIPIASQIIALADVYDALTTGRDYKKAISKSDAIAIIAKGKGIHFSPDLADLFNAVI